MKTFGKIIIIIIAFFSGVKIKAQDRPAYSLYTMYHPLYNPAAMGAFDRVNGILLFNYRMAGFDGAPMHFVGDVSLPIGKTPALVGTQVIYEQMGVRKRIIGGASFAYRVKLNIRNYLSFGINAMFQNLHINWQDVQNIDFTDPIVANGNQNYWAPDFRLGSYYFSDRTYVGFSVGNLFSLKANGDLDMSINNIHFYLQGGVRIPVGKNWEIKPSALVKYVVGAPLQGDVNLQFSYRDIITFGGSYRMINSSIVHLQVRLLQFLRLGYAFNAGWGLRDNTFNTGHEVMLLFNGVNSKRNLGVRCPRF